MVYVIIAVAVVAFALLAVGAHLDDKVDDLKSEVNHLYDFVSRQNDRLNEVQKDRDAIAKDVKSLLAAVPALEGQVKELSEPLKVKEQQEKLILDGMNSILNYNVKEAMRAAKDVSDYGEEE